ncbi:hypothetical protein FSW04_08905 [Baekduia soli]|uniref:Arginase family protein n=2 Tax=Baekduia soli TaxID=496014 RepID=A0A5B8U416_9ACTN|nr:hypothetical protein FSW04_08905 [Baekduia soli]
MGAGAAALATDAGLHAALQGAGWAPTVQRVTSADPRAPEVAQTFDLLRQLAADVRAAAARGAFCLVLAGGCLSAAGTVAGAIGAPGAGVVWLDAHADLDTPEDNASGFLDVMALSVLTGGCWRVQRSSIPGFAAVDPSAVALVGVRDLSPLQHDALARSGVRALPGAPEVDAVRRAIAALPVPLYLHVDLDVLDTSVGYANAYAAPGGPGLDAVLATIDAVFDHGRVAAAALASYDPAADRDGGVLEAARRIAGRIARRAREQR